MLKIVASSSNHKKFGKKIVAKRKTDVKSIGDSLKKIADDEVVRVRDIWKDHVDFFKADADSDDDDDVLKTTGPITFFEPGDKM